MPFSEAFRLMVLGKKICHKDFHGGYWAWENNTIMIHCANGTILDIRQTDNTFYTFSFIIEDEWSVKEEQ